MRADAAESDDERQEQGRIRHSENWYPSRHDAPSQSSRKSQGSAEKGGGACSARDHALKCFSRWIYLMKSNAGRTEIGNN